MNRSAINHNCRFLLYRWIHIWRYLCFFIDWIGLDNMCRQPKCSAFTWLTLVEVKSYQKLQDSWSPYHHKENILLLPSPFQLPSSSSSQPHGSVPSFVLILPHPFNDIPTIDFYRINLPRCLLGSASAYLASSLN